MNMQIEVRAWDKFAKKMIYQIKPFAEHLFWGGFLNQSHQKNIESIMLCCGFADRLGKKIFAGDIVKREINVGLPSYEVKYWVVYYGVWCWMRKDDLFGDNSFAFDVIDSISNCEVVGNIYETPNLVSGRHEA
jgi:uncharacterized phage protein (TIGR01671 family)